MRKREPLHPERETLYKVIAGLVLVSTIYFCIGLFFLSPAYVDFGDGNYLYISSRILDGLRLYRDIVSPQPPVHLFAGTVLLALGRKLGSELYTVRVFLLLWRLATMAMVVAVAWRLFKSGMVAFLTGLLFLLFPIGFWWSRGYQSENWLILWLTASFFFLLPKRNPSDEVHDDWPLLGTGCAASNEPPAPAMAQTSNWSMMLSAFFAVLALFTNMTALPYLIILSIFVAISLKKRSLNFFIPFAAMVALLLLILTIYSQGHYFENVWGNQIGTYPKENTLGYFAHKLHSQGMKLLALEGGFILLGLSGLAVYLRRSKARERLFVVWFGLFSFGSILFVTKGGTMDYIFGLAEPMMAVFGAFSLRLLFSWAGLRDKTFWKPANLLPNLILVPTLFVVIFYPALHFELRTLQEKTYENDTEGVLSASLFIEQHSEPGDLIFTPPYYAFYTDRLLPAECSSSYIWTMRWYNALMNEQKDPEVDRFLSTIFNSLNEKKVKVVFLHTDKLYGIIPEIRQAVESRYRLVSEIRSLNETLEVYLPRQE